MTRRGLALLACALAAGCVGNHALVSRGIDPADGAALSWLAPAAAADAARLAQWRAGVGPPIMRSAARSTSPRADAVTIVSWNTALGAADVPRFVSLLPDPGGPLVLMLQEVYRAGAAVPADLPPRTRFAGRHGGAANDHAADNDGRMDVERIADALGLAVYYVPSMRNGGAASNEDRGNAILSNLALDDLTAIELPFERQRRVAIGATIAGGTAAGQPWQLRLVNVHLDNMAGLRRGLLGGELGRIRQARGLLQAIRGDQPTVLAGDFNTVFGFGDRAYLETAAEFPDTYVSDRRRTFRGLLRLDHFFFRLAAGWRARFHRAEARFGSDHYPLVATVTIR